MKVRLRAAGPKLPDASRARTNSLCARYASFLSFSDDEHRCQAPLSRRNLKPLLGTLEAKRKTGERLVVFPAGPAVILACGRLT